MVVYILKSCVLQEDVAAFLDKQVALEYSVRNGILISKTKQRVM